MVALGVVAILSACATSPHGFPASVLPSPSAAAPECPGLDLRTPDGQIVYLTGRWIGSGDPNALPAPSVYFLRQTNSCLAWVGLSAQPGEALGDSWIETFSGQIHANFTIAGSWEMVSGEGRGEIVVDIVLVPVGDRSDLELRLAGSQGDIHRTKRWVREAEPR